MTAPVEDMGTKLRRGYVTVSRQFLHRADVVAILEQVGRKAVAQRVWTCRLDDPRPAAGRCRGSGSPLSLAILARPDDSSVYTRCSVMCSTWPYHPRYQPVEKPDALAHSQANPPAAAPDFDELRPVLGIVFPCSTRT